MRVKFASIKVKLSLNNMFGEVDLKCIVRGIYYLYLSNDIVMVLLEPNWFDSIY